MSLIWFLLFLKLYLVFNIVFIWWGWGNTLYDLSDVFIHLLIYSCFFLLMLYVIYSLFSVITINGRCDLSSCIRAYRLINGLRSPILCVCVFSLCACEYVSLSLSVEKYWRWFCPCTWTSRFFNYSRCPLWGGPTGLLKEVRTRVIWLSFSLALVFHSHLRSHDQAATFGRYTLILRSVFIWQGL